MDMIADHSSYIITTYIRTNKKQQHKKRKKTKYKTSRRDCFTK